MTIREGSLTSPRDTRPANDTPEHWRAVRRTLNAHRYELADLASRRYPATPRVANTPLLCRQEWIPGRPLDLDEVKLNWSDRNPALAVRGSEPESAPVRPVSAAGERYPTYADALGAIDSPAVFENRRCYRL